MALAAIKALDDENRSLHAENRYLREHAARDVATKRSALATLHACSSLSERSMPSPPDSAPALASADH